MFILLYFVRFSIYSFVYCFTFASTYFVFNVLLFQSRIKAMKFLSSFNLIMCSEKEAAMNGAADNVMHDMIPSAQLHFLLGAFGLGVLARCCKNDDDTMQALKVRQVFP